VHPFVFGYSGAVDLRIPFKQRDLDIRDLEFFFEISFCMEAFFKLRLKCLVSICKTVDFVL